jgi:hypothetical protein
VLLIASILASVATIAAWWAYGNRSVWGPILALAGQVPWAIVNALSGAAGLWICWVFVTVVQVRNLRRWMKVAATDAQN